MHQELSEVPEYASEDMFFNVSKEQEAFFAVVADNSMTCMFPYYAIEAVTHVVGRTKDLRKAETLAIVLGGQQSVIIQGSMLCKIRFELQSRKLRDLRVGYKKEPVGSDIPFVIASIEVPILKERQ